MRVEDTFTIPIRSLLYWAADEDSEKTWSEMQARAAIKLGLAKRVIAEIKFQHRDDVFATYRCWAEWDDDVDARRVDEEWEKRP